MVNVNIRTIHGDDMRKALEEKRGNEMLFAYQEVMNKVVDKVQMTFEELLECNRPLMEEFDQRTLQVCFYENDLIASNGYKVDKEAVCQKLQEMRMLTTDIENDGGFIVSLWK